MSNDPSEPARAAASAPHAPNAGVDARALEAAASALRDGALVALPTDGYYALGARADRPAARLALSRALGDRTATPPALVVASAAELRACELGALARRIASRHWPGPLVLELRADGSAKQASNDAWMPSVCPAEPHARALAAALGAPLCISHVQGACAASELAELPGVAYAIDRGPSPLCEPPAWLRVARGAFELVREGLYGLDTLRAAAGLSLRFVCTGNTCRSPMAEGLARTVLAERLGVAPARVADYGFDLSSLGTFAAPYQPPSAHAVEALAELGIDIAAHRSRLATSQAFAQVQLVYCLTRSHRDQVRLLLPPDWSGELLLLDERADVSDPIGGSLDDYRRCARQIRAALERRADDWV